MRRVRFIGLRDGEERRWLLEDEDLVAVENRLTVLTDRVRSDTTYEPTPGRHCRHCPFASGCRATTTNADTASRRAARC